jgi:LmbE family N-acetylglucosaminyl deacetylase
VLLSEELIAGKILFIGAHPDDIEIGCGGTAAKYADRGDTIAFAIASRESDDVKAKQRVGEARKAARILGLSQVKGNLFFGDLPDTRLDQKKKEVREWLKKICRQFEPDTVFFHRKDDHTDHQAIYKVSIGVFQNHNVLLYYIPRPFPETPFKPNYAVDISNFIKQKVAMCKCHASQSPEYISKDSVTTNSHYFYQRSYGRTHWRIDGYAEGFALYASRSPVGGHDSDDPSVPYELRLVKKADGTLRWED